MSTNATSPEPEPRFEEAPLQKRFSLVGRTVRLGSDRGRVDEVLPGEGVAAQHAQIDLKQGFAELEDLSGPSGTGTLVNAIRIEGRVRVWPGDCIKIGTHRLVFDGASLVPASRYNKLVCRNLERKVPDTHSGGEKTLLDDVTAAIRAGEFVCILGLSGAGKSKLLLALCNREPATGGKVLVDGKDFYTSFEECKERVAVVRQEEPLHDLLTVRAALDYTARLRLPPRTTPEQRLARLEKVVRDVQLVQDAPAESEPPKTELQIRKLSGGQKKRTILANEVLGGPSLLFVDEVTSGLDERTDREIMGFLRGLADAGTTVVCVTHSLANIQERDLLLVLAEGGKLVFFGTKAEAKDYFAIDDLRDLYAKLETPESLPDRWRQAELREEYVTKRLDLEPVPAPPLPSYQPTAAEKRSRFLKQSLILTGRYARIQLADWRTYTVLFGQCLLAALLLVFLFGDLESDKYSNPDFRGPRTGNLLFLLSISCLWFGCNNSAKEIVKEREIYLRERNVNLFPASYYTSKIAFLWIVSLLQAGFLLAAVRYWTPLSGNFWGQALVLVILECTGVTLGLLISVVSPSNDFAATCVPIALLPQIILAGVTDPLKGVMQWVAWSSVTSYSGFRALASLLDTDLAEPLRTQLEETRGWSYLGSISVVLLHLLVFMGAAMFVLLRKRPGHK
jgi:ABC-type multidrug transport system ATPase subunit